MTDKQNFMLTQRIGALTQLKIVGLGKLHCMNAVKEYGQMGF